MAKSLANLRGAIVLQVLANFQVEVSTKPIFVFEIHFHDKNRGSESDASFWSTWHWHTQAR